MVDSNKRFLKDLRKMDNYGKDLEVSYFVCKVGVIR